MDLARAGNKYLADTEPWKLFKKDECRQRTETILNICIQLTATLAIVSDPFLPFTSKKLIGMLNIDPQNWNKAGDLKNIPDNHSISQPSLLFSNIDDEIIERQIVKLKRI